MIGECDCIRYGIKKLQTANSITRISSCVIRKLWNDWQLLQGITSECSRPIQYQRLIIGRLCHSRWTYALGHVPSESQKATNVFTIGIVVAQFTPLLSCSTTMCCTSMTSVCWQYCERCHPPQLHNQTSFHASRHSFQKVDNCSQVFSLNVLLCQHPIFLIWVSEYSTEDKAFIPLRWREWVSICLMGIPLVTG